MAHTPAPDGVTYEPATVGGVPGWWCRPEGARAGAAILFLHGGAYVIGSAAAFRHVVGQLDLALTGDSHDTRAAADPLLSRAALDAAARLYAGTHDRHDPRISPLFGDVAGLPPVLVHVGEDEVLLDDGRRYAARCAAAGAPAECHVWQGMAHVFPSNVGVLEAAGAALDHAGEFLREHLAA